MTDNEAMFALQTAIAAAFVEGFHLSARGERDAMEMERAWAQSEARLTLARLTAEKSRVRRFCPGGIL